MRMPQLPIINMTPEEKEEFRKQEAAYKTDVFTNPRDQSHANLDRGEDAGQMSLADSVAMHMHTTITPLNLLSEMYKFTNLFGIDNDMKV